jgi:hypothetical protein
MDRLDRVLALARRHRPDLRLVVKQDVPWMRTLGALIRPLSPGFLDRFTTVIGDTVYLPRAPERLGRDLLARILCHELVHQIDQEEHGAWFYVSYGVWPLPVGRTGRAHWERRGYAVDLMLAHHDGGEAELRRTLEWVLPQFTGPAYGWMWAGQAAARSYLEVVADEVRAGTLQTRAPYDEILAAWRG